MSDKDKATPAEESKDQNLDKKNDSTKDTPDADDASNPDHPDHKKWTDQRLRAEKAEKLAEEASKKAEEAGAKVDELTKQLETKADPKGEVSDEDLQKLADEHDIPVELVTKLSESLVTKATTAAEKLVSEKLSEKDKEAKKEAILSNFKKDFDEVAEDWEGTISESAVRMHFLAEKAKNPDHSVSDSIGEIYGSEKSGKATVEDDPQGADPSGESINFEELSKDPEKLETVLKDSKARTKYYTWRDKQGL